MRLMAKFYDMMVAHYNTDELFKIVELHFFSGFSVLRAMRMIQVALIT